jgi:hypothetical protein
MIAKRITIIFLCLLTCLLYVNIGFAGVIYQHIGSNDPLTEGWIDPPGTSTISGDVTWGSINDNGTEAWYVDDSDTVLNSGRSYQNIPSADLIDQSFI